MFLIIQFLICSFFCVKDVLSFPTEALHDYMNEPELAYYFQTADKKLVPEYEVIYLPVVLPIREAVSESGKMEEIDYSFSAFQRPIDLKLQKNENIISPNFKTFIYDDGDTKLSSHTPQSCHYIHKDSTSTAAISICQPKSVQGLIFFPNATLELHPLTQRLQTILRVREPLVENLMEDMDEKVPHIIKRANFHTDALYDDVFPIAGNIWSENEHIRGVVNDNGDIEVQFRRSFPNIREAASHRPVGGMTVELAFFLDEAAYRIFAPFMNNDDKKLQDMLLAYMNGVQALYHHPSLGQSIELALVRMDIMKRQPSKMPHYDGERSKLLDSFCAYQEKLNPQGDSDPDHWDMGLYVSGLDFYAYENGRRSGVTMGLATVGGVCLDKYACIIAELGTTNVFGKPYPSAGFTSVYILAHEIGHNLGMHHDSRGNSCPKDGYIMSPSRGTNGETQWSYCSAEIVSKLSWAKCLQDSAKSSKSLDHSRYLDSPGQVFTAKQQCEILLRDKDAIVSPNQDLSTICYNLQCKTPHRSGYYFAGPALDGSQCANGQYCFGGSCVNKTPPKPIKEVPGGWGPWKDGPCKSDCIEKSRGSRMQRRHCNNPLPVNTDQGCEGSSVEFSLCKDDKICKSKRTPVVDYASKKCKEFSKLLPELDPKGSGLQAPHENGRVWMGCAIFCRRADSGSFYTPRIELNDLGVSPYFPDGTWCHTENNLNYYCIHHHCLPENFKFTRTSFLMDIGEDVPFSQNAHPLATLAPAVKTYLSLDQDGKPIQNTLDPADINQPKEEDWETNDYIERPELIDRFKINELENQIDHF